MDAAPGTSIAVSLRVAQAMGLARRGKLKDAQALLSADRAIPEDTLSLEVLAALATAEGDYLRGLRLWEQLLLRNPEHTEARRMIDAIEVWLSRPTWAKYVPLGAATVAAVAVAGLFWALISDPEPIHPTKPANSTNVSPVANTPAAPAARPYVAPATPTPGVSFPAPKTSKTAPKR